jgi:hypothetical protein
MDPKGYGKYDVCIFAIIPMNILYFLLKNDQILISYVRSGKGREEKGGQA